MKSEIKNESANPEVEHKPVPLEMDKTSSDFSLTLRCFQLRRDIYRMLDLQWVAENCNYNPETSLGSSMEVHNMSEFLEKIKEDDCSKNGAFAAEKRTSVRRYELVDRWKVVCSMREEI